MKFYVCLAIQIFALTEAIQRKSVNIALETVLEFDNKETASNLKLIDNVQRFLNQVKRAISKRTQGRRINYDNALTFSDFVTNAVKIIQNYDDDDLENIIDIIDEEIRKYNYEGCKFHEILQNDEVRRLLTQYLDGFKYVSAKYIRKGLHKTLVILDDGNNVKIQHLIRYINSLYTKDFRAKFEKILDNLKLYQSKTKRANLDLTKIVRDGIRTVAFDSYTKLSDNVRKDFKHKLNSLWKDDMPNDNFDRFNKNNEYPKKSTKSPQTVTTTEKSTPFFNDVKTKKIKTKYKDFTKPSPKFNEGINAVFQLVSHDAIEEKTTTTKTKYFDKKKHKRIDNNILDSTEIGGKIYFDSDESKDQETNNDIEKKKMHKDDYKVDTIFKIIDKEIQKGESASEVTVTTPASESKPSYPITKKRFEKMFNKTTQKNLNKSKISGISGNVLKKARRKRNKTKITTAKTTAVAITKPIDNTTDSVPTTVVITFKTDKLLMNNKNSSKELKLDGKGSKESSDYEDTTSDDSSKNARKRHKKRHRKRKKKNKKGNHQSAIKRHRMKQHRTKKNLNGHSVKGMSIESDSGEDHITYRKSNINNTDNSVHFVKNKQKDILISNTSVVSNDVTDLAEVNNTGILAQNITVDTKINETYSNDTVTSKNNAVIYEGTTKKNDIKINRSTATKTNKAITTKKVKQRNKKVTAKLNKFTNSNKNNSYHTSKDKTKLNDVTVVVKTFTTRINEADNNTTVKPAVFNIDTLLNETRNADIEEPKKKAIEERILQDMSKIFAPTTESTVDIKDFTDPFDALDEVLD